MNMSRSRSSANQAPGVNMEHQPSLSAQSVSGGRVIRIFVLLGLSALLVGSASAQLYKWVDDKGNVHYGDCPPADCRSQEIQVPEGPAPEDVERSRERTQRLIWEQEAREEKRKAKRALEQKREELRKEELARRCKVLQSRLFLLKQPGVVTFADAAGNLMRPSDEMREQMIREIRAFIEANCE